METHDPFEEDVEDQSQSEKKIGPKSFAVIGVDGFNDNGTLVIRNTDNVPIVRISRNPDSNPTGYVKRSSYTLAFPNGERILLPVPGSYSSRNKCFLPFAVSQGENAPPIRPQNIMSPSRFFEIEVKENVFRIENPGEVEMYYDFESGLDVLQKNEIEDKESGRKQIEAGEDGIISGEINGGRFCAATYRELGKSKYEYRNEDNIGVNTRTGTMVVADGMGGNGYGDQASHFLVDDLLKFETPGIKEKLHHAGYGFNDFVRLFGYRDMPNSTLSAVSLNGNLCQTVCVGDCRFLHVRNGKCVHMSIPANFAWQMYMTGNASYVSTFNSLQRNTVTSTIQEMSNADYMILVLEKGDILVIYDDGIALSEAEIVKIVSENDPDEAVKMIIDETRERNMFGTFDIVVDDEVLEPIVKPGEGLQAKAPRDNASVIVYSH